jgi:hypothetical protein
MYIIYGFTETQLGQKESKGNLWDTKSHFAAPKVPSKYIVVCFSLFFLLKATTPYPGGIRSHYP